MVAARLIGGGNAEKVGAEVLVGGDANEFADMGMEKELDGGGMLLLMGGGARDGVIGFAPRARAADDKGLGVAGSDWVEIGWGATDNEDRVDIVGGGGD